MKLYEATNTAERILHTYFSILHKLRKADIFIYKLQIA